MERFSDWLGAFKKAAEHRRYLVAGIFAAAIFFFDWIKLALQGIGMSQFVGMPSWAAGIIVLLGFIVYWLLARLVELERQITKSRTELSRLRHSGVRLRNHGRASIVDAASWKQWEKSVLDWNRGVIAAISKISEADAEWFSVLDVVPPPRLEHSEGPEEFRAAYHKLFREHDFRVRRLGQMIYRLWGK